MKNWLLALAALAVVGCASTKAADWQGAAFGEKIPRWVRDAAMEDREKVAKDLRLEGKQVFVLSDSGADLEALKIRVDKLDAGALVARELSQASAEAVAETLDVIERAGGTPDKKRILTDLEYNFTNLNLRGLRKETSFWLARKNPKKSKDDEDGLVYEYYAVFSMDDALYQEHLTGALGGIDGLNAELPNIQRAITKKIGAFLQVDLSDEKSDGK